MKKSNLSIFLLSTILTLFITSDFAFASDDDWVTSGGNTYISSGNVGIGTSNPNLAKLEISTPSLGTFVAEAFSVEDGTYNPRVYFKHITSTNNQYLEFSSGYSTTIGYADWIFNNGNVGIGTSSPDTDLHVIGTVKIGESESTTYDSAHLPSHGGILLKSSGTQSRTSSIYQDDGSGSGAGGLMIKSTHKDTVIEAGTVSPADILLNPTTGGKVGIGTTTPNYKLDVLGTIRAEEVKVETGWSDFVFEEEYNLPTLNQVESYIKENKHLPDIPSAKEVEEEGLSMAEMMAKQMQKIEELTLYVIEQNKRIESLEKELAKRNN